MVIVMHRINMKPRFARRRQPMSEVTQLLAQQGASPKGRDAPYVDRPTTSSATTCMLSKIIVQRLLGKRAVNKIMAKVEKAVKATRTVRVTNRNSETPNVRQIEHSVDGERSVTQREIRGSVIIGIPYPNGRN